MDQDLRELGKQGAIDIKDFLFKLLSYWKVYVIATIIGLFIARYVNKSSQRIYDLSTTIEIKEKQNPLFSSNTNIAFNWGGVSNKVETIRSIFNLRSHNEKVVRALELYIEYFEEGEYRYDDCYGKVPFKVDLIPNSYQVIGEMLKVNFKDNNTGIISFKTEKLKTTLHNYQSESTKIVKSLSDEFSVSFTVGELINTPYFQFVISKVPDHKIIGENTFYIKFSKVTTIASELQKIRTKAMDGTSNIVLQMSGPNKSKLSDILNTTVTVLQDNKLSQKTNYARSTRDFIDKQFEIASDSLKYIESKIGDFKKDNNIYDLSMQGSEIYKETFILEKKKQELESRHKYFEDLMYYLDNNINFDYIPAPAIIDMEDNAIAESVRELTLLHVQREKLLQEVTMSHPSVLEKDFQIDKTNQILKENISSLQKELIKNINQINNRFNKFNSKLNALPVKEQKLLSFQRQFALTEANYIFLMQKRYEASIAIAASVSDISILDTAKDIGQPSFKPNIQFNYLIGILLGVLIPLLLIIIRELLNKRIYTAKDVERLTDINLLGVIGKSVFKNNDVVYSNPNSFVSETFRALRTNLHFILRAKSDKKSNAILISSSVPKEGKSFTSLNLASVFAMTGKKTVILGFDLRKPKLQEDFTNLNSSLGLVDYLIGQQSLDEITFSSEVDNLFFIPSGIVPPNPSELILSAQTEHLFNELRETFDYIIIDTPPIGIVSDGMDLMKYADTMLYVVRQGYSEKGMLKIINTKHKRKEIESVNIILNAFDIKNASGYGNTYGFGYGNEYGYASKYGYISEDKVPKRYSFWTKFKWRLKNLFK